MDLSFPIASRSHDPELMDQPGVDPSEKADAYRVLRRVNRQFFGGVPVLRRELKTWWRHFQIPIPPERPLSVLDVAGGSGDLAAEAASWLSRRGVSSHPLVLDLDPTALALARAGRIEPLRANALRLPLPDDSVDLVIASKFAHHLAGEEITELLTELGRVSRSAVMVLDLYRHRLAWAGFRLWSLAFTRNRLVRIDGPLSVLRGFLPQELDQYARSADGPLSWTVRRHPWYQLALVGYKGSRPPGRPECRAGTNQW